MLCAWWAQGDATRSDTDEDKTSTHLEEDLDKFRDLRATGARVDGGQGWGPVFLPGEPHGQRSLLGYSPWGQKELDTTEQLTQELLKLLF